MKIEIGESLVRSWVRHCRRCQFAELNWKPSPRWGIERDYTAVIEAAKPYFLKHLQLGPFRQNASVNQFLRQAEIDVLGLRVEADRCREVLAVDVAFHTGGLNYGSKKETVERVVKKLFRTALIVDGYIPGVSAEIVFATPKINPQVLEPLQGAIRHLDIFFSKHGFAHCKFRLVANETFCEEIIEPVRLLNDAVADTSEIFLRAAQLIGMTQPRPRAAPAAAPDRSPRGRLPITLDPELEEDFKRKLLRVRRAIITTHYRDGHVVPRAWIANNFSETSSVMGNLRSRPEFRTPAWQNAGISRVEVRIEDR